MTHDDSTETIRLLDDLQQGSTSAFTQLLSRHEYVVRDLFSRNVDTRLRARLDKSDLIQETRVEAFKRIADYLRRRPMAFRHWLLMTARERLLKARRHHIQAARRSVERETSLSDSSSQVLSGIPMVSATEWVRALELTERVQQALSQMDPKYREVIILRYFKGLSNPEIGDLLGLEPATVSQRHGLALPRLHGLLSDDAHSESAG